ncbi:chitin synthase chs-2-like isoform X1 [Amblyomma americanum]
MTHAHSWRTTRSARTFRAMAAGTANDVHRRTQQEQQQNGCAGRPSAVHMFKESPPEDADESETSLAAASILKSCKVLAYVATFAVVLCGSVLSKSTLLLMTAQIQRPHSDGGHNRTRPVCKHKLFLDVDDEDTEYVTGFDKSESIAWMWVILFAMFVPEVVTFIRSVWTLMFKVFRVPRASTLLLIFTLESLHVVGISLFVFTALPELDALRATMISSCVAVIPVLLKALSQKDLSRLPLTLNISALLVQCSGLVLWSVGTRGTPALAAALLLSSCAWWECFADEDAPVFRLVRLRSLKQDLDQCRLFVSVVLSPWRVFLMIVTMLVLVEARSSVTVLELFGKFHEAFQERELPLFLSRTFVDKGEKMALDLADTDYVFWNTRLAPVAVAAVHATASYVTYRASVFACRVKIQGFSMVLPLTISGPVTMLVLAAVCALRHNDTCFLSDTLPPHVFFNCYEGTCSELFAQEHAWVWFAWFSSLLFVTLRAWRSQSPRMAAEESLFARPWYSSALLEQSVALNIRSLRRLDVDAMERHRASAATIEGIREVVETSFHSQKTSEQEHENGDDVTRIYACATMWHESKDEMLQLLKSVLRMDSDQSARRLSRLHLGIKDKLYYVFETHIIFDDAFKDGQDSSGRKGRVLNDYVHVLIETVNEAACSVYGLNDICLGPPRVLDTPYGGRLEWTMPGRNALVVHLKDRARIRNKKRWSQVMYMYYLLGHRLEASGLEARRRELRKQNSFILALDGDISFRPEAVLYLLDHMKNNPALGAACGRIHPVGSGPMVWYQKFEYAVGHWLQKATEHVLGCVLCSPGCFSLFRSEALMADNVLKTYCTKSTEALHFVQYDQGEDRWLCTLLLKQGYQVEYSAASDAYTRCPESFEEFFTQRRRWTPSTMANIIDILLNARRTARVNSGISLFYMAYQGMLMVGTILGPGTIFLMLVGAFVNCFNVSNLTAFTYNAVPVVAFVAVCFLCSQKVQILVAQVLSAAYALLMAAVVVGTALQIREDGIAAPSSIFFVGTTLVFVFAALVHPQEVACLVHGLLYFVLVPAMYLILALYSVINLNVVSWGTRETSAPNTVQADQSPSGQRRAATSLEALASCRIGDLVTCLWCTKSQRGATSRDFSFRVSRGDHKSARDSLLEPLLPESGAKMPALSEEEEEVEESCRQPELKPSGTAHSEGPQCAIATSEYTMWRSHPALRHCSTVELEAEEKGFWNTLITEFLQPEQANDASKVHELQEKLNALRNSVASTVLFCNAMYILVIVLLQHHRDSLYITWPLAANVSIGYVPATEFVQFNYHTQHLEPIGVVFVAFFAFILLLQVSGMMVHRFHTFSHVLASISILDSSEPRAKDSSYLSVVKELQTPESVEDLPPPTAAGDDETWRGPRRVDLEFVLGRSLSIRRGESKQLPEEDASTPKPGLSRRDVTAMVQRHLSDAAVSRRARRAADRSLSFYS